ncbi:MAG: hypothetical protein ACLU9V_01315 [Roseburia sp.]
MAFRLSPEENEELTNRVKMCGCRTRQEYIIQSILHQKRCGYRQSANAGIISAESAAH